MSDEREIDRGEVPPIGSDLWRVRFDERSRELARIKHETAETVRAIDWAIDQIFPKKPPPF